MPIAIRAAGTVRVPIHLSLFRNIDTYVRGNRTTKLSKGSLRENHAITSVTPLSNTHTTPDRLKSCSFKKIVVNQDSIDTVRLSKMNGALFLGSFIKGDTVLNGQFAHYALPSQVTRKNMKIFVDILGVKSSSTVEPTPDKIHDELSNMIGNSNVQSFSWIYSSVTISTRSELEANLGFTEAVGIPAEIIAALTGIPIGINLTSNFNISAAAKFKKKYVVISSVLSAFEVGLGINHPKELYEPTTSSIANNALYLSSITYGRRIYIFAETTEDEFKLKNSLDTALELAIEGIGITGSLKTYLEAKLNNINTNIKIFVIGGDSLSPSYVIDSVNSLENIVNSITQDERAKTMVPISYKLSFLDGSGYASVNILSESTIPECREIAKYYQVKLKSIKATKIVDAWGDEEIYGDISVHAEYTNDNDDPITISSLENSNKLFDRSSSNITKLEKNESIILNKTLSFRIPTDHTVKFIITSNLKDKVMDDGEDWGTSATSVSYDGSSEMKSNEIAHGKNRNFTCKEIGGSAKLEVYYSITPE